MNIAALFAELRRRMDNLIRVGTVEAVAAGRCRVKTGSLITDWRPYLTQRAGTAKTSWRPTKGEQVVLLSLSGDLANAYVLPAIYSNDNPEPDEHPTRHRTVYPDKAVIEYDPETGALSATGIKTAIIQASEKVTVDSPETLFTGNVVIQGTANVQQKLTAAAGADVTGTINHQGALDNTGGVTVDGTKFGTHTHGNVQNGNGVTGEPQ